MEGHYGNHTPQRTNPETSADATEFRSPTNIREGCAQHTISSPKKNSRYLLKPADLGANSKGRWIDKENFLLIELYKVYGADWGIISGFFNNRSELSVKNHFNSLKQRMPRTEQIKVNQERKTNQARGFRPMQSEKAASFVANNSEEATANSFLSGYSSINSIQKINQKCLIKTLYETNLDIHENGDERKAQKERILLLKELSKIIERNVALKKVQILKALI